MTLGRMLAALRRDFQANVVPELRRRRHALTRGQVRRRKLVESWRRARRMRQRALRRQARP